MKRLLLWVAMGFSAFAQIPASAPRIAVAVMNKQVVSKARPVYPVEAKAARIQGIVRLDVLVGPDGHVQAVQLLEGPSMLTQAAIDAVRQWIYQPMMLNGQPTAIVTQVEVNFTLQQ